MAFIELGPKDQQLFFDLRDTKTIAPVTRRFQTAEGYRFEKVFRPTSPIDFPAHPGEFCFKIHEGQPDYPLFGLYVNLRNLPDFLLTEIAEALAETSLPFRPDCCTGIPIAGEPIGKRFSEVSGIPYRNIYQKIEDGNSRSVIAAEEVEAGKGHSLLIVDDVIAHGKSKEEALLIPPLLGYREIAILVLINRQQGGVEQLREMGHQIVYRYDLEPALNLYLATGRATSVQYQRAKADILTPAT